MSPNSFGTKPPKIYQCKACMDGLPATSFPTLDCNCKYCEECLELKFRAAVNDPLSSIPVTCCNKPINAGLIWPRVKHDKMFIRKFNDASNDKVPGSCRCPNKDCGEWLEPSLFKPMGSPGSHEHRATRGRAKGICPNQSCLTPVCLRCKSKWHPGKFCPEDEASKELVKDQGWQRCPKCKVIVEKVDGCNQIECKCECSFCYLCGRRMGYRGHNCPLIGPMTGLEDGLATIQLSPRVGPDERNISSRQDLPLDYMDTLDEPRQLTRYTNGRPPAIRPRLPAAPNAVGYVPPFRPRNPLWSNSNPSELLARPRPTLGGPQPLVPMMQGWKPFHVQRPHARRMWFGPQGTWSPHQHFM